MENLFFISLNIRTCSGIDSYAQYSIGDNEQKAVALFGQLKGSRDFQNPVLTMDLTEMRDGIPFPVSMLACTLEEVLHNTKIITRELFKSLNLEAD